MFNRSATSVTIIITVEAIGLFIYAVGFIFFLVIPGRSQLHNKAQLYFLVGFGFLRTLAVLLYFLNSKRVKVWFNKVTYDQLDDEEWETNTNDSPALPSSSEDEI